MKFFAALASILIFAPLPALASGNCIFEGQNQGSPDVFKFVTWHFGLREGRWLQGSLTLHNNLHQTITWFELTVLVNKKYISFNMKQLLPADSDAVIRAKYAMSDQDAAGFEPRVPLVCVRSTEDASGGKHKYN